MGYMVPYLLCRDRPKQGNGVTVESFFPLRSSDSYGRAACHRRCQRAVALSAAILLRSKSTSAFILFRLLCPKMRAIHTETDIKAGGVCGAIATSAYRELKNNY
jgi:hypothetical protein